MAQVNYNFYLNNALVPAPDNWQELEVELSFENNAPDASVRSTAFVWKGSNAAIINEWFDGSLGIWEGIPFEIQLCNTQDVVFNGIIDLTQEGTLFSCDIVKIKCRDQRIDMANALMKSISFGYLWQGSYISNPTGLATLTSNAASGFTPIQTSDFIKIPYVRSQVPDWFNVGTLAISMYTMIQKTIDTIIQLGNLISTLAGVATTAVGIAEAVLLTAELVLIVVALINLANSLYENLIGDVRYKYGMRAIDMINSFCSYFGITFQSSIFGQINGKITPTKYTNLVIMPKKTALPTNVTFADAFFGVNITRKQYDETLNPNAYGYFEGTPWDLMNQLADMFNAKCKVVIDINGNQILTFERWDYYYNNNPSFTLPNISSEAPFVDYFETNASELAANYFVQWQIDTQDNNTLDDYAGTNTQVTFSSIRTNILLNNTRQNLNTVNIAFAHAIRKNYTTSIENIFNTLSNVISGLYNAIVAIPNAISKFIGGKPAFPVLPYNTLLGRIGYMLLSSDLTGVPKAFIADIGTNNECIIDINNKPAYDQNTNIINTCNKTVYPQGYLGAQTLVQNWHFSNFVLFPNAPAPYNATYLGATYYNQYKVYKDKPVPVCCKDFSGFRNTNWIKDYEGEPTYIDSIPWNPFKSIANMNFRTLFQYDNNTTYTLVVDGN